MQSLMPVARFVPVEHASNVQRELISRRAMRADLSVEGEQSPRWLGFIQGEQLHLDGVGYELNEIHELSERWNWGEKAFVLPATYFLPVDPHRVRS